MVLLEIVAATLIVSLISFVGVILLGVRQELLSRLIPLLVALSVGVLLGDVFIHIMPEAIEKVESVDGMFLSVLIGIVAFFAIEKFLLWSHHRKHHHDENNKKGHHHEGVKYSVGMILFGDGIHNFFDGVLIAASFISDFRLGVFTTLAIMLHEIPQEIGDFAVLINGGLTYKKAVLYNFLSAVTAGAGGILSYFFLTQTTALANASLPFAAGGLLYIAASDLIPELHKELNPRASALQVLMLIFGVMIMFYLKSIGI